MAKIGLYRQFYTYFWSDPWVQDLDVDAKLLFVYLFANDNSSMSGIYETSIRTIAFETGIERERVAELLNEFEVDGKAMYDEEACVVWVVNMRKYYTDNNSKRLKRILDDIDQIPNCRVKELYKQYIYTNPIFDGDEPSPFADDVMETDLLEAAEVYGSVTGLMAFRPSSLDADLYRLGKIIAKHGDKSVEYLKPFYKEWTDRGYQRINSNWLDWAIGGEIPKRKAEAVSKYTPVE